MLIKVVPYYPAFMRQTHRIIHHLNVASNKSCAIAKRMFGRGMVKHYGR
jgi:hypothetical protein